MRIHENKYCKRQMLQDYAETKQHVVLWYNVTILGQESE